jgi:hypothetical protein
MRRNLRIKRMVVVGAAAACALGAAVAAAHGNAHANDGATAGPPRRSWGRSSSRAQIAGSSKARASAAQPQRRSPSLS